jgi:hypothetical protein
MKYEVNIRRTSLQTEKGGQQVGQEEETQTADEREAPHDTDVSQEHLGMDAR